MTKCIIPARQSIPEPTSSSDVSSSDVPPTDTSSSNISSSNISSSNSTSSNSSSSNSPSSSTPSTNNIGFYIIIIGILITITVIGVISYFVFFNNHLNKSIDITNKGGYYYLK